MFLDACFLPVRKSQLVNQQPTFQLNKIQKTGIIFSKLDKIIINLEFYVQLNHKFGGKTVDSILTAMVSKIVELLKDIFSETKQNTREKVWDISNNGQHRN